MRLHVAAWGGFFFDRCFLLYSTLLYLGKRNIDMADQQLA